MVGTTLEEKLIQQQKKYAEWIEEQKKQREQYELTQTCTFRPQITELDPKICKSTLDSQRAMLEKPAVDPNKDKCVELYELSKLPKKAPAAPVTKETDQTEPAEPPKKAVKKKPKPGPAPKAYEGAVNRLINARKDKELLQAMKEKGFTYAGGLKKSPSEKGLQRNEVALGPTGSVEGAL